MAQAGYETLPTWKEILPPGDPNQYPLWLTTGARNLSYTHSQFHNIASLQKAYPEPTVEIHQKAAKNLGIKEGEEVFVETTAGRARLKAVVIEDIREDVVQVTHGWPGDGNANLLIDIMVRDKVSGFPAYKSKRCRLLQAS
jgi:anaerobic selenocysteine-containing dehydrogenase